MHLIEANPGVYVFECSYTEKSIPKEAGFKWDAKTKKWWTTDKEAALNLGGYASPELFQKIQTRIQEEGRKKDYFLELSRATTAEFEVPCPEGLKYLDCQQVAIKYAVEQYQEGNTGVLLGEECGVGKSIESIGIMVSLNLSPVILIAPASLSINWRNECLKWILGIRREEIVILEGIKPYLFPESSKIIICNYNILQAWVETLVNRKPRLIIFDEIHFAKSSKALRSQACWELVKQTKAFRLGLTGTPIPNRPVELLMPLKILGILPKIAKSEWDYLQEFTDAHRVQAYPGKYVWDFEGASNLDRLQERLRAHGMIRRLKSQVMTELPPMRRQVIELPATGVEKVVEQEKQAWKKREKILAEIKVRIAQAKASKDEQGYFAAVKSLKDEAQASFTEIFALRHKVALAKLPMVLDYLHSILDQGEEKVVVFGHHQDVLERIYQEFAERAVLAHGGISKEKRQEAVERFQKVPADQCGLFVGSIGAMGTGHTLTASAHGILVELPWVPGEVAQVEARIHRHGQEGQVLFQHLVLEGSLDARMAKRIVEKQEVINQALDEGRMTEEEAQQELGIPELP